MKQKLAKLSLVALSLITFACNNNAPLQSIGSIDNYNSLTTKKARSEWLDSLSPDLQNYYAEAKGKTGLDLFNSLHDIISKNNTVNSYNDSRVYMFSVLDNITQNGETGVIDVYSQVFIKGSGITSEDYKEVGDQNKDGASGDIINAEHSWPQSFYGKSLPMVGDLHSLQIALSTPNVMRRDFPFGEVKENIVYSTSCGSKLSVVDSRGKKVPYNTLKQMFLKLNDDTTPMDYRGVFEPCDPEKGNTARAIMYFYLRYHDMFIRQGSYDKQNFWMSKIPYFVKWTEKIDPVNDTDRARNEAIFKKQGNRNPFVDIPNLTSLIGETVIISLEAMKRK